jgi:hypothetical protein
MSLNVNSDLRVVGIDQAPGLPVAIQFDEFVPLQFQSFDEPLGCGYLRLGNYSTSLLELAVAPNSQVLRGLTVTSYDDLTDWPSFEVVSTRVGLPIIHTSFEGWRVVDLDQQFYVSTRSGEILVFWEELSECEVITFGERVQFLVQGGSLCGIKMIGLTQDETRLFASHVHART